MRCDSKRIGAHIGCVSKVTPAKKKGGRNRCRVPGNRVDTHVPYQKILVIKERTESGQQSSTDGCGQCWPEVNGSGDPKARPAELRQPQEVTICWTSGTKKNTSSTTGCRMRSLLQRKWKGSCGTLERRTGTSRRP